MGKEAALTRLQPDDEQTEPQHYWLKHYRASEVSGRSMARICAGARACDYGVLLLEEKAGAAWRH